MNNSDLILYLVQQPITEKEKNIILSQKSDEELEKNENQVKTNE